MNQFNKRVRVEDYAISVKPDFDMSPECIGVRSAEHTAEYKAGTLWFAFIQATANIIVECDAQPGSRLVTQCIVSDGVWAECGGALDVENHKIIADAQVANVNEILACLNIAPNPSAPVGWD